MNDGKFRNPRLLALAAECPFCWGCGNPNDGTVVAAHSNQLADGKGRGTKAHDFRVAFLCYPCHVSVDEGRDPRTNESLCVQQKHNLWEDAHRRTIGWLFLSGHLKVV